VQPHPGAELTDVALRAALRKLLENYKVPRSYSFVSQMPRTLTGKTDKRALASAAG
jgi:acyl-CoA synthetase (AMP-forming)/AMP-acid ligase II